MRSLTFTGMSKSYGDVPALADVDLSLTAGRVHALMGENGAGKSTLIKLIAGVVQADTGYILQDGLTRPLHSAQDAHDAGFRFIHQELNIVPQVSVAENILLGRELPTRFGIAVDWALVRSQARQALAFLDAAHIDVSMLAGDLPAGDRMMMKIAAALVAGHGNQVQLYVFDEPTAALSKAESDRLFDVIERLTDQGAAVLYVSHRMDEVLHICDDVTVLRDGRRVMTTPIVDSSKEDIIKAMTGRAVSDTFPPRQHPIESGVVFRAQAAFTQNLHALSFELHAGEILGVSGLAEAGQSAFVQLFMGLELMQSGEVEFDDGPLPHSPSDAWARGVAYIPRERRSQALCLNMPVRSNILLPHWNRYGFRAKRRNEYDDAGKVGKQVRLKCNNLDQAVSELSGGNQQKVVFARALMGTPKLLLLDEPTRGVDVGAKYDIYQLVRDLSAQGCAVVLTTSDLPEVLGLCDRVLVLQDGWQAHLLDRGAMSSAELLAHCYPATHTVN
ncbi:MAG: sugar ABC transporter ATP-binding protein [Granulosicoccus sp.]